MTLGQGGVEELPDVDGVVDSLTDTVSDDVARTLPLAHAVELPLLQDEAEGRNEGVTMSVTAPVEDC